MGTNNVQRKDVQRKNIQSRPAPTKLLGRQFAQTIAVFLKSLFIAALSFVVMTLLLQQIIASPSIPMNLPIISPKFAYYQAHKDEYNTLFFGSSRIYHHVDPAIFDAEAQAAGLTIHSFNFGISGLKPLQSYVLMRDVLKDPPKHLKWVFIEDAIDRGAAPLDEVRSARAIYWHSWTNTRWAIAFVLSHPYTPLSKKIEYTLGHLIPFVYHQLNLGSAIAHWQPGLHISAEDKVIATQFLMRAGYRPIDFEMPKEQFFLENIPAYQQEVAQLAEKKQQETYQAPLTQHTLTYLEKMVATARDTGAQPIFVVAPTTVYQETIHRAFHQNRIEHLLTFNDPNLFPELFAPENRKDWDHLHPQGAQQFTKLLAKAFLMETEEGFSIAAGLLHP